MTLFEYRSPRRAALALLVGTRSLLAASFFVACNAALGQTTPSPGPVDPRLQQFIEQSRRAATAALSPQELQQHLRQRQALLNQGEAALAQGDTETAQNAFDRAALLEHAADTEMALVRTYMQAGNYRRAVSFGAHTAGAHRQVVAGAVLYGWLLGLGGQETAARQLLDTAAKTYPHDAQLREAQRLLQAATELPSGRLLQPPARLAPYSTGSKVATGARALASGLLLDGGQHAMVPLSALPARQGAGALWVRNGLGQTRMATVQTRFPSLGLALLKLQGSLPLAKRLEIPLRDPFPGSPAYAVQFTPSAHGQASWPHIHSGLQGMPLGDTGLRQLGIGLPGGANGGPVLDAAGRVVGMAIKTPAGKGQVVMTSQLRSAWAQALGAAAQPTPAASAVSTQPAQGVAAGAARAPIDEVYEHALRFTLQVIAKP